MYISDSFKKSFILKELRSSCKTAVLAEMVQPLTAGNGGVDRESVVNVLLEREKMGSTGIGDGIAIPHGKMSGVESMRVGFGRSAGGIDFDALDGKPVHLFFLLLAPEASSGSHLRALAKISRMLKDNDFKNALMKAESDDDIYQIIVDMDRHAP